MRRLLVVLVVTHLAMAPAPAYAADVAWDQWKTFAGVFDADGTRSDGSLTVAGSAALYRVDPSGTVTPFARGPGGYHDDPNTEAYLAVSPGGHVTAAGCSFVPDETFLLRVHAPLGVTRVTAAGEASGSFASVKGATALDGIAFDSTGDFDHRLLVSGQSSGKTVIFAIDCSGAVQVITRTAPALEGGLAVAPNTFGSFGGALIAPDELSGKIYAITKSGAVSIVAKPALAAGPDTGVESVGFVPPGFVGRGGAVYYADRLTPKNPHPGNDRLLRLTSAELVAAGVQDGDLLAATEGGAKMVAVRCASSCSVIPVVSKGTNAHGEGHIAFTVQAARASPTPTVPSASPQPSVTVQRAEFAGSLGAPAAALVILLALIGLVGVWAIRRRRGR